MLRTKLAELVTKEFTKALESDDPAAGLSEVLLDVGTVFANTICLCSRGKAENLEKLLPEMEEHVRINARAGLENAAVVNMLISEKQRR